MSQNKQLSDAVSIILVHISTLVGHVINFFVNMKTMYCGDIILAENKMHLNYFHPKRVRSTCFYYTNFHISTFFIPGKIYNSGVNFNTDSCLHDRVITFGLF